MLNRPELSLSGLLVPSVAIAGALGFLAAWLVMAEPSPIWALPHFAWFYAAGTGGELLLPERPQ
jgi:hypothetical protein